MDEDVDQKQSDVLGGLEEEVGGWDYNHGNEEVNNENVDYKNEWLDNADNNGVNVDSDELDADKNTFYDVYRFDFKSVFDGARMFHQEHIKKRNNS